jgi:lipid A ethanolaminephosphotransferase
VGNLLSLSSKALFRQISETRLILYVSVFIGLFANRTFFSHVFEVYPVSMEHGLFLITLFIVLALLMALLAGVGASKYTTKPILIFFLILSAFTGYFMDSYKVVIDQTMLINTWETNSGEAGDQITLKMILYLCVLGILPAIYVWRVKVRYPEGRRILYAKLKLIAVCLVGMLGLMSLQGKAFASFFREHKPIRYYANPAYCLYSAVKFVGGGSGNKETVVTPIGFDAVRSSSATGRKLVIFVVGESARADRFSLNGYERETNPLLQKRDVISFKDFTASGTSTAVSVPVMFSIFPHKQANMKKVKSHENILDVLSHGRGESVMAGQ